MRLRSKVVMLVMLVLVVWFSCASASQIIKGSGSTFIYPIFEKWAEAYHEVNGDLLLAYKPVGSLQGIDQLLSHSADFAASDAPIHLEQMAEPGCQTLYVPAVLGAVVVIYNLPEIPPPTRLKLDGHALADVYLGKISKWNDPAIAALNPGTALPDRDIVVNYRRDGSGTTYTFTDYLSKADPQWAKLVGRGMVAKWPTGLAGGGNDGVAEAVRSTAGAIGYVELSYAVGKSIPFALIKNTFGNWVEANPQTISAAADSLADQMPTDQLQSITAAPGQMAYPIASYSYLLVFKQQTDTAKAEAFGKFLHWVLHNGQNYAREAHYAALPPKVADLANLRLQQIAVTNTTAAAPPSCKASLNLARPTGGPGAIAPGVPDDISGALSSD